MNAETFCEHFATFADAPNGVQKLRAMILQLAVQGKLVPQDPNDEPASKLLGRISADQKRREAEESARTQKALPPISADEILYELPDGWAWGRLGNIGDTNIGLTYSPQDVGETGVPVLRSSNIQNGRIDLTDLVRVSMDPKSSVLVADGDLLICARNGSRALVGKVAMIEHLSEKTAFGAFMAILRSSINEYLYHFICSPLFRRVIADTNTTTINQITQSNLRSTLAPIPPLAEQRRIVEKVDQLLGLCDELAARQAAQREKRQRLVGATLDRLVSTRNAAEFPTHAHRLRNHFDQLFDTPTTIPQLRQTILQLAVQGQLVPQDPDDEPATDTVRRVEHERRTLIADGKLREEKLLLPTIEPSSTSMPLGWADVRLGHIINCLDHIRRPVSKQERETKRGKYPYYGANGQVGWIDDFLFDEDLVLVVEDESFIGRIKPFSYKITGKTWVNNHAHVLQPTVAVDADFLNYALSFYPFTPLTSGTTNRKKLTKAGLMNAPFQLPPLAEQKRIAWKVTELLSLCDALEAKLTQAESASTQLLSAAVDSLLTNSTTAAMSTALREGVS